ncbi:Tryptophan--tRNA ligase [Paramyrothecium foliicola]|nr:Tryptophan--tRNA ligase [Paramyrothecium foliicola]
MQRAAATKAVRPRVVFSGIQPTGIPHLGNYAGALRQWVQLQHQEPQAKLIYSIVDLHAITVPQSPDQLRKWRRESLAALMAIGLDPDRSVLFYQSSVPAHSELMWILSCTASVGYLSRMTQWKQKLSISESANLDDRSASARLKLGLFSYPVLQAADILVHRATHVPVGHDQQQHLEFARECVTNFNHAYGPHLIHPQTITPPVHRIMSLTEPTSKMSKSHPQQRSRILITDTPDEIRTKLSRALTDSLSGISYDIANRPGISNLLDILATFDTKSRTPSELATEYADLSPKQLKEMVTDAVVRGLDGIQKRYVDLTRRDDAYLDMVAEEGARKARESAEETMHLVKSAIGL